VVATQADVSDAEQTRLAVERTIAELGRLDVLVVNAGGPLRATFDELDDDRWETAHQLTFMSAVHLIRAALPALRESDSAAILFISSTSVKQPIGGLTLSNAIRGSISGLAKTLSNELAPQMPGELAAPRLDPHRPTDRDCARVECGRSRRLFRQRRTRHPARKSWRA